MVPVLRYNHLVRIYEMPKKRVHEYSMTKATKGRHGSNNSTWTAYIAITSERRDMLEKLLSSNGFNPNIPFRGEHLLTTAVKRNDAASCTLLLSAGADPNLKSEENGRNEPPLITLIRMCHGAISPVFPVFISQPTIDFYATNFYGQDALYSAVAARDETTLAHLLEKLSFSPLVNPEKRDLLSHRHLYCPFMQAIFDTTKGKKNSGQCLTLLLKYNYYCSCFTRWFDDNTPDLLLDVAKCHLISEDLNKTFYVINTQVKLTGQFTPKQYYSGEEKIVKLKVGEPFTLKVLARRSLRKCVSMHCRKQNKCENFYSTLIQGLQSKTNVGFLPKELLTFVAYKSPMKSIVVQDNNREREGDQSFTCFLIDV